jgi:hypothetical protein
MHCIPSTKTASCYACTLEHCGDALEQCTGIPINRELALHEIAASVIAEVDEKVTDGGMCTTGKDADQVNDQKNCAAAVSGLLTKMPIYKRLMSPISIYSSRVVAKSASASPDALTAAWKARTDCRRSARAALVPPRSAV